MRFKIYSVSGPSHQLFVNGQPCDQWSITINLTPQGRVNANMQRYYAMFAFDTEEKAEQELLNWRLGEIKDLPLDNVFWVKGGKIVKADR